MGRELHVSQNKEKSEGFHTIQEAASVAEAGDRIVVHEGTYREWVRPKKGGKSNTDRIIYEAAEGEKVIIKGSEIVDTWENTKGNVWKATIANTFFGEFNPYKEKLEGDWMVSPDPYEWHLHLGEVYMNGKAFYESRTLEELDNPQKRETGFAAPWMKREEALLHPEDSIYQWHAIVDEENTHIYANFQGANPNEECVEINVRRSCFYPEETGRDYITVRGFEMAQAATPWTPPTADQPGLIGANWSKGWIIENNIIHDSKCSGISIGKEASTGHNECTFTHRKPGYQYQMEAVFKARQIGWSKEKIGSHIIRNNTIYDCGQNGIVGHMGCVFSEIAYNHIYNIAVKHEYFGYEIGGIKLHAAIDVQIHHNNIHNCSLGTWLDWQIQGTRISKNLFYENDRDLMIEVTHGPHIVDNNIFASDYNFDNIAQGGAFINNLCCGTMRREPVLNRATPYHRPHSTEVAGVTFVYGGDDRWYQNIFIGGAKTYTEQSLSGTIDYNGSPASMEEYIERIISEGNGDNEVYELVKDPVYIHNNGYLNGALSYDKEKEKFISAENPKASIVVEEDGTYLEIYVEKGLLDLNAKVLETKDLGRVRIVEAAYEDPCGNPIVFDSDYLDQARMEGTNIGPVVNLKEGRNKIKVW
ncbi:alpha-N-arabinofuranosidase [Aequitasia blattaphilus]|uniref:Right-handed parallel beta-helix repeat-containing protein n=1 Tax=Aequitasia blattaphilus TaxID=2949332 RepID=A0ABT1E8L0_9FIRM|nr:right-handed parallel beta-helix repeat-containing protein [Aequitasia blattaphilus]MCP1102123.1 right-handed parallel beta-helix repeat-containing protein [Aequitasia blattaphilus]MCR8614763.1 right-handed parallel beta-helix repeat-containing protein [Aequitasia blattaphilus]